jgi:exosome complex exonuclease DIS3/RRP44
MLCSHNESFLRKLLEEKSSKVRVTLFSCNRHSRLFLVIRERYLRDDVSCGIEKCRECISSPVPCLPFSGAVNHKLFPKGHFVLPDTNVFLAQVCLLRRGETFSL